METNGMLLAFTATTLAFLLNLYLIPSLIYLSHKKNWFDDASDERKIHTGQISRLGGIGISLSLGAVFLLFTSGILQKLLCSLPAVPADFPAALLVPAGVVLIFLIGILDDFANLRARIKLIGQVAAALLVILGGARIRMIALPFTDIVLPLGVFGPALTLFWLVGMTNAVNLIDGMDGLSSTICGTAALLFGVVFFTQGQILLGLFCFALLGAVLGYIFYNFPPARIFMGDSGSLTLGFLMALLPLLGSPRSGDSLLMPVAMLAIPIADVFAAMIRRKRQGMHFFTPDRAHMHHKLLDMGLNERQILSLVIGIQAISGFSFLFFSRMTGPLRYLPVAFSLTLVLTLFLFLHYRYHGTLKASEEKS